MGGPGENVRLALIPGDGVGPEVITEAVKVLGETLPGIRTTTYDLGAERWRSTGELLPDSVLAELRQHDAILLGAIGDTPAVPRGILERGLLLRLRLELDHHAQVRPIRRFDGVRTALADSPPIDMLLVREGTEGPYAENGGFLRKDSTEEVATEVSVNTAFGVRRVVRYAFELAAGRRRRHLTFVHKTSVLSHAGSLWSRIVEETSLEFPGVSVAYEDIDVAAMLFVTEPGRFDVVVTDNLFGDVLTGLGAAISGGKGRAACGNLDLSRRNPSMFEPVHGSAPELAGQGVADPTAAVLSVALLLDHLGWADQAKRVEAAVAFDLATRDRRARDRTTAIGDRLAALASSRTAAPS
jgi:3-isopropylmalate dehydrogenase